MLLLKNFYSSYFVDANFSLCTITTSIRANEFDIVDIEHSIE